MLVRILLPLLLSVAAQVHDETGAFSDRAIVEAEGIIRQIRQQFGRDLVVEVFPTLPPEIGARQRLEDLEINGVYVLIARQPLHLEIAVSAETQQRAFTPDNAAELRTLMLAALRKGQFDPALLAGVHFVQQTMQRNLRP